MEVRISTTNSQVRRPYKPREENNEGHALSYGTFFYTEREKTELLSTVNHAVECARLVLNERKFTGPLCVNAVSGRDYGEKITLVEHNVLIDQIMDDSYRG